MKAIDVEGSLLPQEYSGWELYEARYQVSPYKRAVMVYRHTNGAYCMLEIDTRREEPYTCVVFSDGAYISAMTEIYLFMLLSKFRMDLGWDLNEIDDVKDGGAKEAYIYSGL